MQTDDSDELKQVSMITFFFLSGIAIVAVFLGMFVIRGRSRQARGMSGVPTEEKAKVAPRPKRASGID